MGPIKSYKEFDNFLDIVEQSSAAEPQQILPQLQKILDNFNHVDKRNVIQLTRILKKCGATDHRNSSVDQIIKEIKEKIFSETNRKGRKLIHECAIAGNIEAVQSLTNLVPTDQLNLLLKVKSFSHKTALDYAEIKNHQGVIAYLNLPKALLTKKIVCKKGENPKFEGLLLNLQALNLNIQYRFKCNNVIYHFTNCFSLVKSFFERKPLVFSFVEKSEKIYPHLFWLSQSQSVWRRTDKKFPGWIGKSVHGEEWLSLPILINLKIFKILQKGVAQISNEQHVGEFLNRVVAWSEKDVNQFDRFESPSGVLTNEIETTAIGAESTKDTSLNSVDIPGLSETHKNNMILLGPKELPKDPRSNDFLVFEQSPDFTNNERTQFIDSPLYGRLKADVFLSHDGTIRFLFLKNTLGHVFLAEAELVNKPLTIRGLKKKWVKLGALSLSLKEYPDQFDRTFISDSEQKKIQRGKQLNYVQTWNYLKEMPCIQNYYRIPPQLQ
ncbi:hypothetical protein [Candidatus Protochlamydia amoebophila]|uniref:hypothetical protein n=1 Tax=Candidatus Protochlamydia amoebophila TaxID=362787 RepID=UPI001BC968C2|nr:hypothetical protein [Candidatus Protochlamydia amoebophila]